MRPQSQTTQPAKKSGEPQDADHGKRDLSVAFVVAALLGIWLLHWLTSALGAVATVPYSQFESWVADGQIAEVVVGPDLISGDLKAPTKDGAKKFQTTRVDPQIAAALRAKGVIVSGAPSKGWLDALLSWILPGLLFYIAWSFMFRRIGAGEGLTSLLAVGKSKARLYVETDTKVTFADVAGVDEAKLELQEVVAFLKNPAAFGRLGARAPKGILLVGPPGTGKTLLARAVAGEAGVPFLSISGSEFVEMFVGVGAARVRDLFDQARKAAPSIIFIDELDALGRSRVNSAIGGLDEKEQTLNQLLAEIDGFDPSVGVILLAATNRPETLDKALLRAGRFDRQVLVDRPDRLGRLAILQVHVRKIKLSDDIDLGVVAALTTGFAGADLANLVNEAAIAATRRDGACVTLADFEVAIERIVAGIEKRGQILGPDERRRVAYHEMGHALVASALPSVDPVQKVSIIPRGLGALGYTLQRPTADRFVLARSELEDRLTVLLGGRAAEAIAFNGDISTGASDDLDHATQMALDMVERYGMDRDIGGRTFTSQPDPFLYGALHSGDASQETQREIDLAVREIIGHAETRAADILGRRRPELDQGAAMLLEKETLTAHDFPPLGRRAAIGAPPVA